MKSHRAVVVSRLKQLMEECAPILRIIENQELTKQLRADKLFTLQHLEEKYKVCSHGGYCALC